MLQQLPAAGWWVGARVIDVCVLEVTDGCSPWSLAQKANWGTGGPRWSFFVFAHCTLSHMLFFSLSPCQWLILQRDVLKQRAIVGGLRFLLVVHRVQGSKCSLHTCLPLLMVMESKDEYLKPRWKGSCTCMNPLRGKENKAELCQWKHVSLHILACGKAESKDKQWKCMVFLNL